MAVLPLIRNDLLLLARQRRWFIVRGALVALILAVILLMFHSIWKQVTYGTPVPLVAADSFRTFSFLALFFVALPAPAFGVGAFDDAYKPGSLDLLRLASIPRPVLGWIKLLGAAVWPILLAGSLVPFLALWPLWGGVDLQMVAVTTVLITATAIALAGLGLLGGAVGRSSMTSFGLGYGLALVYFLLFPLVVSAISYPTAAKLHAPLAMWQVAYGSGLGGIGGTQSVDWTTPTIVCVGTALVSAGGAGLALMVRDLPLGVRPRKRHSESAVTVRHALLWRELRTVGMRRARWLVRGSWVLSVLLIVGAEIIRQSSGGSSSGAFFAALVTAYPLLPCLVVAILGAASVTTEKEAGTLTPVLLTPHSTSQIIGAKLSAIVARAGPLFIAPALYGLTVVRHEMRIRADDVWILTALTTLVLQVGGIGVLCSVLFRKTSIALSVTVVASLFQIFTTSYVTFLILDEIYLSNEVEISLWALQGTVFAVLWVYIATRVFRRFAV